MTKKIGRNDPCSCGSGEKYKNCCMTKSKAPRKIKATWVNQPKQQVPQGVNLMERTFGDAIAAANLRGKPPEPISITPPEEVIPSGPVAAIPPEPPADEQ